MQNMENCSNAAVIDEVVSKYRKPEIIEVSGTSGNDEKIQMLVLPDGLEAYSVKKYFDEYRSSPERLSGNTELTLAESFNDFVNRFKNDNSALFYNQDRQSVRCIFDCSEKDTPRFETHTATYNFPISDEWRQFMEKNNEGMSQIEFVEFIEKNIINLSEPLKPDEENDEIKQIRMALGGSFASVAKMIELSRGIKINVDETAATKINYQTGETTIEYNAEHRDGLGNTLKLPSMFAIAIPVLKNGKRYRLVCHLRYRLYNGKITWFYEIINADKAVEHAISEELDCIKEKTSLPLFYANK